MGRTGLGLLLLAAMATAPLWVSGPSAEAESTPVTWARDLDGAVQRAASTGKPLAILFR